jgi:nitrite reductase/ring-hydroxylating ferredoxin subunit
MNDFKDGTLVKVQVENKELVISIVNGKIYAIDNECTHPRGPLNDCELKGYDLKCPLHYAEPNNQKREIGREFSLSQMGVRR